MFLEVMLSLIGSLFLLKFYLVSSAKKCVNNICLSGRTVVVTGANTGIGFISSLEFAKRGARVILACRDKDKAERAKAEIIRLTENDNVAVKQVDFSSLESVKQCARDILQTEEQLDILVNNAGAAGLLEKTTPDGLELLMQINYFGPVLFTLLLLGLLKKSPKSRIINVSSILANKWKINPRDINRYAGIYGTYSNSKVCSILFTITLAGKLKNSSVSVFSLHPGVIKTDIFRRFTGWKKLVLNFIAYFTFKTPENGAETIIYTATEPDIEKLSGQHFEECHVISPYFSARDPKLAEEVWKETCRLLQINENTYI